MFYVKSYLSLFYISFFLILTAPSSTMSTPKRKVTTPKKTRTEINKIKAKLTNILKMLRESTLEIEKEAKVIAFDRNLDRGLVQSLMGCVQRQMTKLNNEIEEIKKATIEIEKLTERNRKKLEDYDDMFVD